MAFKLLPKGEDWNTPWTDEQRARYARVLGCSSDRSRRRRSAETLARETGRMSPDDDERAHAFLGEHYEAAKAESEFRRDLMDTAKAIDEGRLPRTPEAVNALLGRQQEWMDSHPTYIVPPEDLNFDALKS